MRPILFTWIAKNAGSSLYKLFKEKFGMRLFLDGQYYQFDNKGSVTFGHASVKDLIKAKIISQEYWDSALCLTVVRHPYHRFLSLYEDFKRSQRIAPHTTPHAFAHMLQHLSRNIGTFNAMDYSQCASQVSWLLPGVTILRYETLQEDINELFPGQNLELPRENIAPAYHKGYGNDLKNLVYDLYREDFVTLGYQANPDL